MQNYFNYYTEIEEHFQRRRGTLLMLSTLDWALIATWQEAGFPLAAVLAGIDATFEKYAARQAKGRVRRINGLAFCAQEVMRAVEDMHEAATGAARVRSPQQESGFESARVAAYLHRTTEALRQVQVPAGAQPSFTEAADRMARLAGTMETSNSSENSLTLESLEQQLVAIEDQLFTVFQAFAPVAEMIQLREQSARELAPYRSRLQATQIHQIEQQFLRRALFQQNRIPRLSLFHMPQI